MHFDEQRARQVLAPVHPQFWLTGIKRHWHGELPLPFSFWGAGVFVYLTAHFSGRLAAYGLSRMINPIAVFLVLVGTYGLMFVGALWWWVGTWRANKRYRTGNDPKSPWPPLVTIVICLSILRMVYTLWGFALPQIDDAISDITEDSGDGPRGVNLIGRDEIEVYGPLTRSVTNN
jgi:hypothetical protein